MQDKPPQCICDNANGLHWGKCPLNMQSAPRGDQQWTPETVRQFWRENQKKELQDDEQWNTFFKLVADAHNAALAAERQQILNRECRWQESEKIRATLEQQLAAEREKLKPLVDALGGISSGLCNTPVNYPAIFAKDIKRICDDALATVKDNHASEQGADTQRLFNALVEIRDHVKGFGERPPSLFRVEEMCDAALSQHPVPDHNEMSVVEGPVP